jgi:hypothetical protein
MFGYSLGHRTIITGTFLALGLLTAVVGALFCFRERHLKRLLAFSTISHAGMFLTGIALLTPLGLAGAAIYVAGHALVKAALFLCVGIVLHRLGSVNETWLHGRGRQLRATGLVFTLAALGLADWRGQRLCDLDRDRRGLRGRHPGVRHPVTTQSSVTRRKRELTESSLRADAQRDRGSGDPPRSSQADDSNRRIALAVRGSG